MRGRRLGAECECELSRDGVGGKFVTKPVVNTVEATTSTHDPEPANNKHSVTVDVTPEADLELKKTAPPSVITGRN